MNYGCYSSGSSAWAEDILDLYFGYQSGMQHLRRQDYDAGDWLALYTAEFDADPPRPVIMVIGSTEGAGHEVVADGYQDDGTTLIHINMGWEGYEDGYYNITSDFQPGGYTWDANFQSIVTGIEPDNAPPVVNAGEDQTVEEQTRVYLNGSAVDPEGVGIAGLLWTQTGGPAVNLSDHASSTPFFTAPPPPQRLIPI